MSFDPHHKYSITNIGRGEAQISNRAGSGLAATGPNKLASINAIDSERFFEVFTREQPGSSSYASMYNLTNNGINAYQAQDAQHDGAANDDQQGGCAQQLLCLNHPAAFDLVGVNSNVHADLFQADSTTAPYNIAIESWMQQQQSDIDSAINSPQPHDFAWSAVASGIDSFQSPNHPLEQTFQESATNFHSSLPDRGLHLDTATAINFQQQPYSPHQNIPGLTVTTPDHVTRLADFRRVLGPKLDTNFDMTASQASGLPSPLSDNGSCSEILYPSGYGPVINNHAHYHATSPMSATSGDEDDVSPVGPSRRNEEPPLNAAGKIICTWDDLKCKTMTFARKCEWTKHMDKHDRPYNCHEPGCENLRGFTYSGGLARHAREVHGKNAGSKKSYYCPETSCKRASGNAFTRKENLHEHIRRIHPKLWETMQENKEPRKRAVDDDVDVSNDETALRSSSGADTPIKSRKRSATDTARSSAASALLSLSADAAETGGEDAIVALKSQIRTLKTHIAEREAHLNESKDEADRLKDELKTSKQHLESQSRMLSTERDAAAIISQQLTELQRQAQLKDIQILQLQQQLSQVTHQHRQQRSTLQTSQASSRRFSDATTRPAPSLLTMHSAG